MRNFLAVLCFLPVLAWSDSITLMNNSIYTLNVAVYGADGSTLGQFTLAPQNTTEWTNEFENLGPSNSNTPLEPFTVNWYCQGGAPYGTCTNVAVGSLVTAQSCSGPQECQKPKANPGGQ